VGEFLKLTESYGVKPLRKPTYGFVILFFLLLTLHASQEKPLLSTDIFGLAAAFAATIAAFVFLTIAMRRADLATGYPAAAASAFSFIYVALPLAMLVQLRQQWAGSFLILYLLLVVWAGDILAYFVGKSVGRHLMAPRISPKKTWEGAAAALVASMAVGGAMFYYSSSLSTRLLSWGLIERRDGMFGLERPGMASALVLTAVLNVAAQLGDLVESLIKRGAGVKDSGTILPGHGGMLDRIDALLFAAPVLWVWAAWRVTQ
jgi:phosphatidate cytidylyltransferase